MFSVLYVYPSVHVCTSGLCVITSRGRICVWMCIFVRLSHYVQSCLCVSRVDVLKWGHFLSVWCLGNNPTAQKLLQPSASTYLSLYLYCSGYAFLFWILSLHAVWYLHAMTLSHKVFNACLVAHNMRFWFKLLFTSSHQTEESWIDTPFKISDLGSNVCGTVLIWSVSFICFH